MSDVEVVKSQPDDRRRFERVDVSYESHVLVLEKGKKVGTLRQIARGGFMMEPDKGFKKGKKHALVISDAAEGVQAQVKVVVRYADSRYVGFEFEGLDAETAVNIGIIMGAYYDRDNAAKMVTAKQ